MKSRRGLAVIAALAVSGSLVVAATSGAGAAAKPAPSRFANGDPSGPAPRPAHPAPLFTGGPPTSSWQSLTNAPTFTPHHMLLLGDGTVMVQAVESGDWWRLTPDNTGSYVNGTWSQLASMPSGYGPLYYASAVLPDGRVIVEGGEYNLTGPAVETNIGAIYDPVANTWTSVAPPAGWANIGDSAAVLLADGTFMMGKFDTKDVVKLNPSTLTWTAVSVTGKADNNSEEGWSLLPNGKVLTVDTQNGTNTELWDAGTWSSAGNTPSALANNCGLGIVPEIGAQLLRPNGTVLAVGATAHNAVYDTGAGTWSAAPDFPIIGGQQYNETDGPAAILPNGNVLVSASPCFDAPSHFFVYNGTNLTQVADPTDANVNAAYWGSMLVLPTGQVLFNNGTFSVFTDTGAPNPAWKPTISSVPSPLAPGGTYTLSGTQLNGLTEGSAFGDDAQNSTNYPMVRITNNATGHVTDARTTMATRSVAPGQPGSATFTVPAGIEKGASKIAVVANGIASDPTAVTVSVAKPPAGYVVVSNAGIAAPAGVQTHGTVACPGATKPVGGGVYTDSADLAVNVNGSYPTGPRSWAGSLTNGSANATNMTVYAICVKRPAAQFTVTSATFNSPSASQTVGQVACPAGVVVGGGVKTASTSLNVNITSLEAPSTTTFEAWMNNSSGAKTKYTVYAICRNKKPPGYSIQFGASVANPSGADTYSTVTCPGASVPLSGGVYSLSTGLGANLNTYAPFNNTFYSYFNNADAVDNSVQTGAICAGT